jgi:tetratricopeptide (TPR) repeat protein
MSERLEDARHAYEECLQLARTVRDSRLIYVSLEGLIDIAAETGHFEEAVTRCRELVVLSRADRLNGGLALALSNLSEALVELDQLDEALITAREATPLHAQEGTALWVWLVSFARMAYKRGRVSEAALAFGRAQARYGSASHKHRAREGLLALLRRSLPTAELQRLLAEGAALTDEEAAHMALAA